MGPRQRWNSRDGTKWEKWFDLKLAAEALSGNIVFGVADGALRSGGLSQQDFQSFDSNENEQSLAHVH
ncbi:MAG: hypothetical protein DMG56_05340 [Acidobacteria bacterium]|nr:MAG: hypothetical protein DMG56_05340 [Acidobacteriota bacterium]